VKRGFTLLEVMVAIAILGIGLTMILTAQTGLFSSADRAAKLSFAVGLARCKMNEVEVELLRDGFPLTDQNEEGPCCEDDESAFRCTWDVTSVMLPDVGSSGGSGSDAGAGAGPDPIGALMGARESLGSGQTEDAVSALSSLIPEGSSAGAGPSLGAGALAPLAMGFIWPDLKTMLEASIRKVTVTVRWREGSSERELAVSQYLTNPQQGGFLTDDSEGGEEDEGGGIGGSSGMPPGRP